MKDKAPLELTDEQREQILEEFKTTPDLILITRKIFNNEALDGRSLQGRAVKAFLAASGATYKTTAIPKKESEALTEAQQEFLMSDNIEVGINALEAARLTYRDRSIQSLSSKHRIVLDFLKEHRQDVLAEEPVSEKWIAPKALSRAVKKVNDWAGTNYDEITMPTKQKRMCEKLLIYLQSVRFRETINQFSVQSDRDLFESEFVRASWDKPDLTVDEQNLYINMCSNYVRLKQIQKRLDQLNRFVADAESQDEISVRLADHFKVASEDLNQCERRIESLAKDLNGSRQKRLQEKGENGGSILALVEAFQEKEERDRMVLMAQMQNKLIEDEADRLESMDELKARILGICKHELT